MVVDDNIYDLDLVRESRKMINFVSGDDIREYRFRINRDGNVIDLTNFTAILGVITQSGEHILRDMTIEDAVNGVVIGHFTPSMIGKSGNIAFSVKILDTESKRIGTTIPMMGRIYTGAGDLSIGDSDEYNLLVQAISKVEFFLESGQSAEDKREEAELKREEAKQQLIADIEKLADDTTSQLDKYKNAKDIEINDSLVTYKNNATQDINRTFEEYKGIKDTEISGIVDNHLDESYAHIDEAIKVSTDTLKKDIDDYKISKDEAIKKDLDEYKRLTTLDIENYKVAKDTEIDNSLNEYKLQTTSDIDTYKANKDREIDEYKTGKDTQIDNYLIEKSAELEAYKNAKNTEIDNYKGNKDTLINNKIQEVEAAKQDMIKKSDEKILELDNKGTELETRVNAKIDEADERILELQGFESQLNQVEAKNQEQDSRLNQVEYVNKRQDTLMNGLFNENADGRLSIDGEGNSVKLENSKDGVVEVKSAIGNTLVNLYNSGEYAVGTRAFTESFYDIISMDSTHIILDKKEVIDSSNWFYIFNFANIGVLKPNTIYTLICNVENVDYFSICSGNKTQQAVTNVKFPKTGLNIVSFSTNDLTSITEPSSVLNYYRVNNDFIGTIKIIKPIILEGDYTNKPIPDEYIEGMKSCFEDKQVTQEQIDNGEEKEENLGKYKAPIKIVGKNKFDGKLELGTISNTDGSNVGSNESRSKNYIKLNSNVITLTRSLSDATLVLRFYDKNCRFIVVDYTQYTMNGLTKTFTLPPEVKYIRFKSMSTDLTIKYQVEEGEVSTPYEEYKEYAQVKYLNEPLYKGNELCVYEGKIGYWKNRTQMYGKDFAKTFNSRWVIDENGKRFGMYNIKTDTVYIKDTQICNLYAKQDPYATEPNTFGINTGYIRFYNSSNFTTIEEWENYLITSNLIVSYPLAEPIFVPILEDTPKWILEAFKECSVYFDTNIPISSSSFTYTGDIPSVYGLKETGESNTRDIADTQIAVDYLLMNSKDTMIIKGLTMKGEHEMGAYFAGRIMKGFLDYKAVISKYPEFKEDIDFILRSEGRDDLITV